MANTKIPVELSSTPGIVDGSNATAITIDSSERVLVGFTTSDWPNPSFQIEGIGASTSGLNLFRNSNDASGPYLNMGSSRGTSVNSDTIVQNGDALGTIYFYGAGGSDREQSGGYIQCAIDGTPGNNDMPGRLVFATTADGGVGGTERMRITAGGLVGIGTTNPIAQLGVGGAGRRIEIDGTSGVIRGFDRTASWAALDFEASAYTFDCSTARMLDVAASGVIINEDSADADFRVESNNLTHALFVDGGNNNVAIGHSTATGAKLAICDGANAQIQFFPEVTTDTNLIQHYDITSTTYMNADYRAATHQFKIGTSEAMRIHSDGKVGIGVDAPTALLDIRGSGTGNQKLHFISTSLQNGGDMDFIFGRDNGTALSGQLSYYYNTTQGSRYIQLRNYGRPLGITVNDGGRVGIGNAVSQNFHSKAANLIVGDGNAGGMSVWNGTAEGWYAFARDDAVNSDAYDGGISYNGDRDLSFHTNAGSTRMTIDGSGKVGIGTASPGVALHINHATDVATRWSTTSGSAYSFQIGQYYTTWQTLAHPNIWQPIDGSGSSDICITTATNNVKKGMVFDASNNGNVSIGGAESAGISGYAKTLKVCSSEGRFLRLHASDGGGDPDFRVTGESGSGSMWVGHMAAAGILDLYAGGAVRFRIAANGDLTGTDTSISSISDSRLKENIESYTYDNNKFKSYSPKRFDWKNPEQHGDKSQQLGFISQDLESIDTRWVGETKLQDNPEDGHTNPDLALVEADKISKTSSFGPKDAMYISVIQQLITRIEALE